MRQNKAIISTLIWFAGFHFIYISYYNQYHSYLNILFEYNFNLKKNNIYSFHKTNRIRRARWTSEVHVTAVPIWALKGEPREKGWRGGGLWGEDSRKQEEHYGSPPRHIQGILEFIVFLCYLLAPVWSKSPAGGKWIAFFSHPRIFAISDKTRADDRWKATWRTATQEDLPSDWLVRGHTRLRVRWARIAFQRKENDFMVWQRKKQRFYRCVGG